MAHPGSWPSIRRPGRFPALLLVLASESPAFAGSPWRFWNKSDGLAESWTMGLSLDGVGRVVVKQGDVATESVLDGYQVTGIPNRHAFGRFLGSRRKELWSFDTEGILIYDATGWHKYAVPEIAQFAKASPMQRIPWFLYSMPRGRIAQQGERMNVLPVGPDGSGVIVFPDRLIEWNRGTGRKQVIRLAAQSALSRFTDAEAS